MMQAAGHNITQTRIEWAADVDFRETKQAAEAKIADSSILNLQVKAITFPRECSVGCCYTLKTLI